MKAFTKTTLALCVATASFTAQAELKAMDDVLMSDVTGQSGVTIDITMQPDNPGDAVVSVGEIKYTDGGSVNIKNLELKTADGNAATLRQTVDINDDGELVIGMNILDDKKLQINVGSVGLSNKAGVSTVENLASDVKLNIALGETTSIIGKKGSGSFTAAGTPGDAGKTLIKAETSVELASSSFSALDGKVKMGDVSFNKGGAGNKASITQYIWANDDGVNMQLSSISGDLTVGSLAMGKNKPSIGSLTVSNITMSGMKQTIYGH